MKTKNACPECGTPLDEVPFKTNCKAHAAHNKLWSSLRNVELGIEQSRDEKLMERYSGTDGEEWGFSWLDYGDR